MHIKNLSILVISCLSLPMLQGMQSPAQQDLQARFQLLALIQQDAKPISKEEAEAVISKIADINCREGKHSFLREALIWHQREIAKALLDKGAHFSEADIDWTDGDLELVEAFAKMRLKNPWQAYGKITLNLKSDHEAHNRLAEILHGDMDELESVEIALAIIDRMRNPNKLSDEAISPLSRVIGTKKLTLVKALVAKGASVEENHVSIAQQLLRNNPSLTDLKDIYNYLNKIYIKNLPAPKPSPFSQISSTKVIGIGVVAAVGIVLAIKIKRAWSAQPAQSTTAA